MHWTKKAKHKVAQVGDDALKGMNRKVRSSVGNFSGMRAYRTSFANAQTTYARDIIGLHTGECELVGSEVEGLAVHIAARVAATATPGEVLVSRTVKDLVAGSGVRFADRGEHVLKGISDQWQLFSVVD